MGGSGRRVVSHACGARWSGRQKCHCGGCHLTFSGLTAFDKHRVGMRCLAPGEVGLVARVGEFGPIWGLPGRPPSGLWG